MADVLITDVASYHVGGTAMADALGRDDAGTRLFVPGFLPCGECPLCRRGLVGGCPNPTRLFTGASPRAVVGQTMSLPDRFLVPIDEPPGVAPLDDATARLAGLAAFALHGLAVASLAAGDFAIWIGGGPLGSAGTALAQSRGATAFALLLPDDDDALARAIADQNSQLGSLAVAPATAHGARKRLCLITAPGARAWQAATALADAGTTFVAFGAGAGNLPALALPPEARVITLAAYHPDFVPEALAALRRQELAPKDLAADDDRG